MSKYKTIKNLIFELNKKFEAGELTEEECENAFENFMEINAFCDMFLHVYNLGEK